MSALSILAEECELLTDSKYRGYITQVERALKSFDSTSEWADLISALGKLNKVLLAHVKYPVIPKRVTIGKRLAQCLHPALPSGVHMKALETYDIIFKCIGTERLAQDLFIYTAGLFPLLSYAAMNVKPILLLVYERHFVSLGQRIKPGLNGLLLGLLPGLEEGSESYDHTNALLEDFCECTTPSYFYTCLWECVHSCPSVRLPATTFLLSHFNKKKSMEDQLHMMGLNINLMVEALCHAVQDTSVLVQRSLLDFLLVAFPLHNSQLTYSDMGKIVRAAITVLLRRDMSLNRRFYGWLLGSGASSQVHDSHGEHLEVDVSYFEKYSRDMLVQALKWKLSEKQDVNSGNSVKSSVLKPFRMLISLLDKPEIGPVILESVLLSIFRCLYIEFESSKSGVCHETVQTDRRGKSESDDKGSAYDELLKTANLLFGTFEPYFIWDYIARLFELSCQRNGRLRSRQSASALSRQGSVVSRQGSLVDTQETVSIVELCQLVTFLLDIVSLETYSETQTEHLPTLLCHVTTSITQHVGQLTDTDIVATLALSTKILSKVQPTLTTPGSHDDLSHDLSPDLSHDLSHGVGLDVSHGLVEPGVEITLKDQDVSQPLSLQQALEVNKQLKAGQNLEEALTSSKLDNGESSGSQEGNKVVQASTEMDQSVTIETVSDEGKEDTTTVTQETHKTLSRKNSKQNKSANLMQKCIDCFQIFFHTLMSQKILKDKDLADKCFQSVLINKPEGSSRSHTFDRDSCVDSGSELSFEDRWGGEDISHDRGVRIPFDYIEDMCLETFSSACHLLVEFASFPMYSQGSAGSSPTTEKDKHGLPAWVQDLVICCCFVDNFHVQSSAISTMLDLSVLTQSVQMEPRSDTNIWSSGPRSVSILPTLHHDDLTYLAENTLFYKYAAHILWNYLSENTCQHHQQTVKLFHILHQVAPSSWVCENVIGNQLVHDSQEVRVDAFKKFTVLWHLSRHRRSGVIPGKPLRTFDRSMFVVLDSLKEESSAVKLIATTWLGHVIQHGDISRVMEPLLLMLLHPDTARVSIQHVNIHKPRKVLLSESSDDKNEANIYAISSEGGNVIYHVSQNKDIQKKHKDEMKSYALTVLGERGACLAPQRSRSEQELHFEKVDPNNLNLRINPFGSENSLDTLIFGGCDMASSYQEQVYSKAKRLDKETCAKEGINFTENGESTQGEETDDEQRITVQLTVGSENSSNSKQSSISNSTESILEPSEELVKSIVEEVIRNVVKEDNSVEESAERVTRRPQAPRHLLQQRADSISSSNAGDQDLLNAFQKQGCGIDSPTLSERETSLFPDSASTEARDTTDIHTLHMHMLLYMQKFDVEQTMYALSTLKSMLEACPRLLVTSLVTTNISSLRAPQLAKLQLLLARHRKSVFGKNFFGEIPSDVMSNYRSNMIIEILISVCLYFIRGYYPNLMMSKLSHDELLGNKRVHIIATETLTLMLSEVLGIMRDSGINVVSYISDLLQKCKVQKAILHCVLAVIYNNRKQDDRDTTSSKITEAIIAFNEENLDPSANETFQIRLLDLLLVMIMLEDQVSKFQPGSEGSSLTNEWDRLRVSYQPSLNNVKYNFGHPIVQQGMFVSSVLSALKQYHLSHMHRHWIALVTTALPYMGKYLPGIVMTVVSQLCRNLEAVAAEYETGRLSSQSQLCHIPPDHIVTLLNGLMTMCHYCLLDNVSPVSIGQPTPISPGSGSVAMASSNILSNLFNVFNPVGSGKEASPQRETGLVSPVLDARSNILSVMPRIIACMASLWRAINLIERLDDPSTLTMGSPKVVRQNILEFVSPISLPHGSHLMGAIAVAWNDRRKRAHIKTNNKKMLPQPCEDQLLLVDLVSAIRVMPMDTLIQTVKQVLKSPPSSELSRTKRNVPLEVNMLQFYYAFVQQTSANQLLDSWPALLSLLREGLQLNLVPQGLFILVLILNEFVQKTPCMSEKKTQRDVQEIAQRLLEAVSAIAGSCLEQTTWLRKNFAVKPGFQSDEPEHEEGNQPEEDVSLKDRRVADPDPSSSSVDSKYSVQALSLLAELTAPLLDVIYTSDEKDKVAPFLTTLLYNIFPYLKNHSCHNLPSLRAGSQFLSSISSYQYTRKAWKKEALELLLDPSFFQMDMASIGYWLSVIDNLMTHDKTTYKDLMARVSMTQTGSLNLFTNREQEISQKAGMLKRLAFTIFCSEPDQYQKCIPEIQEKLAESLRVPQAPSIMAQVFLCFRVLMLRVSPQHLTSMWPTIITELIHVFLQIEQELSTETEEFVKNAQIIFETQVQRIAALDSSWAHLGNGLNAHNNPSWLQLYLSACKLLDLCLALPADKVPQFQLYRWAFIGGAVAGDGDEEEEEVVEETDPKKKKKKPSKKPKQAQFKPHIIRLARLLNTRIRGDVPIMKMTSGQPLLSFSYLRSLAELQPFFNTLCLANQTDNLLLAARQLGANMTGSQSTILTNGHSESNQASQSQRGMPKSKSVPHMSATQSGMVDQSAGLQTKTNKQFIEDILKRDFLEPMP